MVLLFVSGSGYPFWAIDGEIAKNIYLYYIINNIYYYSNVGITS